MYEAKNFDHLLGTPGFSDALLKNHFTLYQGYVKNVNIVAEELADLAAADKSATPTYAELKRRLGWEWNGMRLHELYFGNMKNGGSAPTESEPESGSKLAEKIAAEFGSKENWGKNFEAVGAMRGIGWVILYFDPRDGHLWNVWVNEHDVGHLAGCIPLLVMDVFEHAYMLDYGLKKTDYIESFSKAIDWAVVESIYERAPR